MKVGQKNWEPKNGWKEVIFNELNPHLVLVFGERFVLENPERFTELKELYPNSKIVMVSTAGNIEGTNLNDQITATSLSFEKDSFIQISKINIELTANSFEAGIAVAKKLKVKDLKHVLLLSDGHLVNGSELVKGLLSVLPKSVTVSGGLAADGSRFEKTIVGENSQPKEGEIVAVGFYGDHLKFGSASYGGWDPFGIERKITKAIDNRLYELNGKPALDLYKQYLGEYSKNLPSSALLFPLAVKKKADSPYIVRTILSIDEKDKAMVFAGDIPEGGYAQLMKANFDRLIDGASQAALQSLKEIGTKPDLALLVSCVGRRLVLDQKVEEELESVHEVFGKDTLLTGFYSYGEISPAEDKFSDLHNQTMTITAIKEI